MSGNETLKVTNEKVKTLHISVFSVMKACFNDEMLLDSLDIKIEDIKGKELFWFDPFLKRGRGSVTVALSEIDSDSFTLLINEGGKIKCEKHELYMTHYITEEYDKSSFIASHIEIYQR